MKALSRQWKILQMKRLPALQVLQKIFSEHEPIFKRFLWRAPWLIVTLCAGLVTATAMSHFKDRDWFTFVALFCPFDCRDVRQCGHSMQYDSCTGMSTGELSHGSRKMLF